MEPPSGRQFEIRHGGQRAVVVEVGGGLREYTNDGRAVLDGYSLDAPADGARGQPLLPWPNRLADGQYEFRGRSYQLPIDEAARRNAIHGLTRWLNWSAIDQAADRLSMELIVHPRPGYPFSLQLQLHYALTDQGLSVRTSARNIGSEPLPFGAGHHPYFTVGTPLVDDATLTLPVRSQIELDSERRVPTRRVLPIDGSDYDFREARKIGGTVMDGCFCDLIRDADGRARVVLEAPGGAQRIEIWMDQHYKYLQVYSGEALAPERRRQGLAVEPMSCPPNAFRSGTDVIVLEPEEAVELDWGINI